LDLGATLKDGGRKHKKKREGDVLLPALAIFLSSADVSRRMHLYPWV
jgi:hypothetical protein